MKVTNMLAKALYDNKAECSDELAFRKGDILTVLDQNIFGSEGWWRCYLHGRQGLAPANRLQLFTITQNDSPLAQSKYNSLDRKQSSQNIYQVPSAPKIEPGSMYERMENLSPATQKPISGDIYQTPICSPAKVFYERTNSSSSQQHLFTLPRASRASNATSVSHPEVYDVPPSKLNVPVVSQRGTTPSPVSGRSPFLASSEQQIYDIPSSPDTPERSNVKTPKVSNVYDIPPTGTLAHQKNRSETPPVSPHYNTLPNPRKSDWIYDIPLSPERNNLKGDCRKISIDRGMVYDVPPARYGPVHSNCASSQIYDVPPQQNKLSPSANQSLYDVPASRDTSVIHQNGSLRKGSSTFGIHRIEHVDSKENVYDIPRGSSAGSPPKSEMGSLLYNDRIYDVPPPLPRNSKPSLHRLDHDRLSVSSSESRTSTLSTSSNASNESFTMSVPDERPTQVTLEPEVAIKKVTELQERVSSSIASLMIFVSSKWRLQENMEANLEDIHRAVDSIISSLEKFIDFSQSINVNASHLTDINIQTRIKTQLQTLTDSFQTLSRNQESINLCNWSLQALVMDKAHMTPDDLDQFVMVARTIPDDIKRFVSIIIANGKLLFKKPESEKLKPVKEHVVSRKPQVPLHKENRILQESCVNKNIEKHKNEKHQLSRPKAIEDNGYVYLQKKEDFEKSLKLSPIQQLENKTSPEEKRKGWLRPDSRISSSIDSEKKSDSSSLKEPTVCTPKPEAVRSTHPVKKIALSDDCYLYFSALQKAIRVLEESVTKNETPEIFITHGKLIIMVGQKLVDLLCQDVKANEARSDILLKSSELCSLLKNLAMATKTAAIQYPNTVTMQELQRRIHELSNYTQLFRAMVE